MPTPPKLSLPDWERVNLSLPRGLKGPAGKLAKERYAGTKADSLTGLVAALLRRELSAKQRLPADVLDAD